MAAVCSIDKRMLLFYRYLNDRQPLFGVGFVPNAIDITDARVAADFHIVFVHVAKRLDERLIKTVVWSVMFHAECAWHGGYALTLNDAVRHAVGQHVAAVDGRFGYLLAVLDVGWRVLGVVLEGVAIARPFVHFVGHEQAFLFVVPQGFYRYLHQLRELSDS